MNIQRVKVEGFRNISNIDIKFDNLTSLLSVNSFGKSNFLNSLIFGFDFIHFQSKEKNTLMSYSPYIPYNKSILLKDFSFEVEVVDTKKNRIIYGYSFEWERKNKKGKIVKEYLKIKESTTQKYSYLIKRDEKEQCYKPSNTGACNKNIHIEDNELIINKLQAFDDLYYIGLIKDINNINIYVDKHFSTKESFRYRNHSNEIGYMPNDKINISATMNRLKKEYPNKYELICNTMKDIFPFITEISAEEIKNNNINDDSIYLLTIKQNNLSALINISDMSDGFKRIMLILTVLVLAEISGCCLVAIEEPENSLNPKILQRYLMVLNYFTDKVKIILTSHSPFLVNYMNPANIYLGIPNEQDLADFRKIKTTSASKLISDSNKLEMLTGEYLFDLMCGSPEDIEIMKKYTE